MKKILFSILTIAGIALTGCVAEEPNTAGEGNLSMKMVINGNITRSETDEAALAEKCVIYISSSKGLIHKYQGIQNVPSSIPMKNGAFVAEAWTGDSVSASFDKKFYRAYEPFEINGGSTEVTLNCKIANVVASINSNSIDSQAMKNWTITVKNSRAGLDFTAENVADAKGYFMMPNGETDLTWVIRGESAAGVPFEKTGVISGVQRAHEYVVNLGYNPAENPDDVGGAFITVSIDDRELLIEDEGVFLGKPVVKGLDFDADKAIVAEPGDFSEKTFAVYNFGTLSSLSLSIEDYSAFGLPQKDIDLLNLSDAAIVSLRDAGLSWNTGYNGATDTSTSYITFSEKLLNRLALGTYPVIIRATDSYGKYAEVTVIFNPDRSYVAPIATDWTNIRARKATVSASVLKDGIGSLAIRYRKSGTAAWTTVDYPSVMNAGTVYSVELTGLEPGTTYEYQAVADGVANEKSLLFTTEGIYKFPNASFEDWSNYSGNSKVLIPAAGGKITFWDSGNHGSAMMSKNITQNVSSPVHSGNYAASLVSQFIGVGSFGKFAAGNIFIGYYKDTDGTDGILEFGRSYNSSHPSSLVGWANYRPGKGVSGKGADSNYIGVGQSDKAQIYIALTTSTREIRTKASDRQLFDPDDVSVVAYGELTFDGNFGADGSLERFEIPLVYKASAATVRPLYIVLVCSASKYGDFFSGGEGSTLIIDDFELTYE